MEFGITYGYLKWNSVHRASNVAWTRIVGNFHQHVFVTKYQIRKTPHQHDISDIFKA